MVFIKRADLFRTLAISNKSAGGWLIYVLADGYRSKRIGRV